jgi:hypothetical protein
MHTHRLGRKLELPPTVAAKHEILRMMLKDELDAQGLAAKPAPAVLPETAASQRARDCTGQQTFPHRLERVGTWSPLRSDQGSSSVTSVVTHVAYRGLREHETRWRFGLPGVCEHW